MSSQASNIEGQAYSKRIDKCHALRISEPFVRRSGGRTGKVGWKYRILVVAQLYYA